MTSCKHEIPLTREENPDCFLFPETTECSELVCRYFLATEVYNPEYESGGSNNTNQDPGLARFLLHTFHWINKLQLQEIIVLSSLQKKKERI